MFFRVAFLVMFLTTVLLTFFSNNVSAQAKARKFDELSIGIGAPGSVEAPLFVPKPRHLEFKAILNTNEKKIQPGFTWRVSPGIITSGQGTDSITVAVPDGVSGSVIARADVSGYSLECPLSGTTATAQTAFGVSHFRFDQYEQICSDDEKARLDNFAVSLQKNPELLAYIVFYGGRCYSGCSDDYPRHRPRYPRKGEAQQRAGRIKPYLEMTRGIDGNRIVVVDGGNRESWTAELWLVVKGGQPPPLAPTVQPEDIQFRRGKPGKREFVIGCLGPNP